MKVDSDIEYYTNIHNSLPMEEVRVSLDANTPGPGWKRKAKTKIKGLCTVRFLRRRFPILLWMPKYNWDSAVYDVIAGITVGLTTIPQAFAYAAVAGLPLQVNIFVS